MNTTEKREIKIGRKTYAIKPGDYITFNGHVHLFNAGDGRTLKIIGWVTYSHLSIPKTVLKRIDLGKLKYSRYDFSGINIEKWTF